MLPALHAGWWIRAYSVPAVSAMEAAYTDAAGRTPDFNMAANGNIGGLTLPPGVYKWDSTTSVTIPIDVILMGSSTDIWIFQISGNLNL